ncbi:MAG TPA: 4a-hydroxytetrahydrobiopterin dehydratase [Actinomycetes bacterium]|nr:4a-hydroxytetrahydrobiopterin dehydratase [Actinomycetes bacterium]
MPRLLDDEELTRQLRDLPAWTRDGAVLRRTVEAPDFPAAIAIVNDLADVAEAMNHHPDIDIRWRTLHLALSTHSAGGITQYDVELAHRIEEITRDRGAS